MSNKMVVIHRGIALAMFDFKYDLSGIGIGLILCLIGLTRINVIDVCCADYGQSSFKVAAAAFQKFEFLLISFSDRVTVFAADEERAHVPWGYS